ncbi:MAG: ferredoxin--NADP reductase [Sorangiineae bacterium]|nr:ferredoxin--NADP reductase [Polyangiaceae bacterium]MEB2321481.1 ferredoxin--NADP reductase [Sorangiineae bacterium]
MSGWTSATIVERRVWADGLATFRLAAAIEPFEPGQWVNLALEIDGELIRRAYSIASAPGAPLEFLLTVVDGGALTPTLLSLPDGAPVEVETRAQGFFTLHYVPEAKELWMVATGTGLGPFMSIVRSREVWERFEKIVLVHGVRHAAHLAYSDELDALSLAHEARLIRVPVVSREEVPGALRGRIPHLLASGELEARAGVSLSSTRSHVMLCGNPGMITDMTAALHAVGLERHRVRKPGHITVEKYW